MENVIILGTGCAGLTAAIYTARANLEPLVIEGGQPGGQLTTTSEVENFPGFPQGVDGFMLMQQVREQATRFGTRYTNDLIESVDFSGDVKVLKSSSQTYEAKSVIIATGASPRLLGVPGEQEMFEERALPPVPHATVLSIETWTLLLLEGRLRLRRSAFPDSFLFQGNSHSSP